MSLKQSTEPKAHPFLSALRLVGYAILLLVWVIIALFLSSQWVDLVARLFGGWVSNAAVQTFLQALEYTLNAAVTVGLPLLMIHVIRKIRWQKLFADSKVLLGVTRWPSWLDLAYGVLGVLAVMIIAWLMTLLVGAAIPWLGMSASQVIGQATQLSSGDILIAFILLVVIAPVSEEIIFRGWMYGKLRRLHKTEKAMLSIIIVSVLFGFVHGQAAVGVVMFIMSIIMCILRERTGAIWAGVFVHILKNGIALFLLFIS